LLLSFTPSALGLRSANATFADTAPGTPHTVALAGTGVSLVAPTPHRPVIEGSLPGGTVGTAYSGTLGVTTATAPLSWSANPTVPGLAINASTGALTGTPTTAGSYSLSVQVVDSYPLIGCAGATPCTNTSVAYPDTLIVNSATTTFPAVGNRIAVIQGANIRATAVNNGAGALLGVEPTGATGTVLVVSPYGDSGFTVPNWVQVKFDSCTGAVLIADGCTGWMGSNNMVLSTTPPPPPPVPTLTETCVNTTTSRVCTYTETNQPGASLTSVGTAGGTTATVTGTMP
jgi:hypothetical protein